VPSQNIMHKYGLEVSSATIRNEMARLKQEGLIVQPHTSAGSVPSDKGYRFYVESLNSVHLPANQQVTIDHLFHQVETRLEEWARLSANILAHLSQNMALVATAKSNKSVFKHVELVSLQDSTALVVLVLQGARLRQQLITFDQPVNQNKLSDISAKLNKSFSDLNSDQIETKKMVFTDLEKHIVTDLLEIIQSEDRIEYEELYLDGLQYIFAQPDLTNSQTNLTLLSLTENKDIIRTILPHGLTQSGVHIFIGKENEAQAIQKCSVVVSRYGLPGEAIGCIAVVGPTRMPYARSIAIVDYLSEVLTRLIARLYGKEIESQRNQNN
jgi:heat-inducible transcriptional repressor